MRICGITAEYNPLHNGHLYHMEQARAQSGCDVLIAVMSGNFVQRGEPAIIDKWERAEAAVKNGIDAVIELPYTYATQSASVFAHGAVHTLAENRKEQKEDRGDIQPCKQAACALRCFFLFGRRHFFAVEQFIDRHPVEFCDRPERFDVGIAPARFPLGNRCARDIQGIGQLFLRDPPLLSQFLQFFAQFHRKRPFQNESASL